MSCVSCSPSMLTHVTVGLSRIGKIAATSVTSLSSMHRSSSKSNTLTRTRSTFFVPVWTTVPGGSPAFLDWRRTNRRMTRSWCTGFSASGSSPFFFPAILEPTAERLSFARHGYPPAPPRLRGERRLDARAAPARERRARDRLEPGLPGLADLLRDDGPGHGGGDLLGAPAPPGGGRVDPDVAAGGLARQERGRLGPGPARLGGRARAAARPSGLRR